MYCLGIIITNGPQDTIVCINAIHVYSRTVANCGCSGASPHTTMPNWRIILRNNDGSVVSNVHHGFDIVHRYITSLQWAPDLTSGDKNH